MNLVPAELKKILANIVAEKVTTEKLNLECIISLESFSSLQRLIRVADYVLRFVSNLKRKKANNELIDGEIKQEVHRAKELWHKKVQSSVLEDRKFDQVKCSLSLFTGEKGILRCGGRLKNGQFPLMLAI